MSNLAISNFLMAKVYVCIRRQSASSSTMLKVSTQDSSCILLEAQVLNRSGNCLLSIFRSQAIGTQVSPHLEFTEWSGQARSFVRIRRSFLRNPIESIAPMAANGRFLMISRQLRLHPWHNLVTRCCAPTASTPPGTDTLA